MLLTQIPDLVAEKFALGSVAPDSGKPDKRWEIFTPPAQVTHFQNPSNHQRDCADMVFYQRHLQPMRERNDAALLSFRLGYFFHLVTDNLWAERIGRPTMEKYREQFAADKDFIWKVKKDWYGLDFIHVREHAECIFWQVFCDAKPERGGLDFLVPESLAWSVAYIQQYYQTPSETTQELYNRPYIYLSQAEADQFVEGSVQRLERIYQYLWSNDTPAEASTSALELSV